MKDSRSRHPFFNYINKLSKVLFLKKTNFSRIIYKFIS